MRVALSVTYLLLVTAVEAQEKPSSNRPTIVCASPLLIVPGKESRLLLRGAMLDEATEFKLAGGNVKVEIASKGKTPVPQNYDAKRVGDSQAELKFMLPPDAPASSGKTSLIAVSSAGKGPAYEIEVLSAEDLIEEKEPNDSFKAAQSAAVGKTISGVIGDARNVDVYRIELSAGDKLRIESIAARVGSLLDPTLTLYDGQGRTVSSNDDHAGSRDSRIEATIQKPGSYFVTVQDANDAGGPHFAYLLRITR